MPTDPKEGTMPTRLVRVDFACNDERGNHTDKAEHVDIGDLELECRLIGGGVKIWDDGKLRIGRCKFVHYGHKYGVGNWCWCAWYLTEHDAMNLVNYLMRLKYWHCDSGPCDQFEKFNSQQPFTMEDLQNCLDA